MTVLNDCPYINAKYLRDFLSEEGIRQLEALG